MKESTWENLQWIIGLRDNEAKRLDARSPTIGHGF
jgi:hypothetical protein